MANENDLKAPHEDTAHHVKAGKTTSSTLFKVGVGTVGLAAFLASCSKNTDNVVNINQNQGTGTNTPATSFTHVGDFAVAYAPINQWSSAALDSAGKMGTILIQPGYNTAAQATAAGIQAMGYDCVFSITPGSLSTADLESKVGAIDGFLKDGNGNLVLWNGINKIMDIRRTDVQNLVIADHKNRGISFTRGTASDQQDLAIFYDVQYPGFQAGAGHILHEAALEINGDPGITPLSGIQPGGQALEDSAALSTCAMILESRIYETANHPNSQKTLDSITDGILRFANPTAQIGGKLRDHISITFLEPAEDSSFAGFERAAVRTADYINSLRPKVEALGLKLQANIEIVPTDANGLFDFTSPAAINQALIMNRQLKQSAALQAKGVSFAPDKPLHSHLEDMANPPEVQVLASTHKDADGRWREQSFTAEHGNKTRFYDSKTQQYDPLEVRNGQAVYNVATHMRHNDINPERDKALRPLARDEYVAVDGNVKKIPTKDELAGVELQGKVMENSKSISIPS